MLIIQKDTFLLPFSDNASLLWEATASSVSMSWAVEEWKDGLPGKALQKIQEMESQLDKLKKERQQKQFQMDSLEATLQKQKQKVSYMEGIRFPHASSWWRKDLYYLCVVFTCRWTVRKVKPLLLKGKTRL